LLATLLDVLGEFHQMAKDSPFVPSAVPLAGSSFRLLAAISHREVENFVVNVNHFAVLFVRLFTWFRAPRVYDNTFNCNSLGTL
jgi:hypothetical protein